MGRSGVSGVPETLIAIAHFLQTLQKKVVFEENAARLIGDQEGIPAAELSKHADLLIVVGGDGSMLNAAQIAVVQGLPVVGINRGHLGFLTDIDPYDFYKLQDILKGNYRQESRFLLDASIEQENNTIRGLALNDVVLLPGKLAQMIEFEVRINNEFVCAQQADGLICATPTGSTAYALSGGGPILNPTLDAMVLVPMFPHTLSSRPLVINGSSQISIRVTQENEISPNVSCDGQQRIGVPPGGTIHIRKYHRLLKLIHPEDYNYYETLRRKLNWEKRGSDKSDRCSI